MATALVLEADGRLENRRWKYGQLRESPESGALKTWTERLRECRVVLDFKPDLAGQVVAGDLPLNAAFTQADAIRSLLR